MQIVPSALSPLIYQSANLEFQKAYQETETWYTKVATEIQSKTSVNVYSFVSKLAGMRKWEGARVLQNMRAQSYSLRNVDWEDSVALDVNDAEDDNLGMFKAHIQSLGMAAKKLPEDALVTSLQSTTELCFDGLTYFHDSHPVSPGVAGGTYDNKLALALTDANFDTAVAAMMAFPGDDGKPVGAFPTHLIVPPQLRGAANRIIRAQLIEGSNGSLTNTNYNLVDVIVIDRLVNEATTFYLLDCSKAIKPLLWQHRTSPVLTARDAPTDPSVWDSRQALYGATARGAAGYTLPFLALKSIG